MLSPRDSHRQTCNSAGQAAGQQLAGADGGIYVWVPAGHFVMGSDGDGDDERPAHQVELTRGFWLGRFPVTNQQYRVFCGVTGKLFPALSDQPDDHPVVQVSSEGAASYCQFYGLRLPTEAEWEYGARGPEGWRYPWGDEWDGSLCCHWDNRGPGGATWPVTAFPGGVSWCGAMDMAGNVGELCSDMYDEDYYRHTPLQDPQGPCTQPYGQHVVRGGGWFWSDADTCRGSARDHTVWEPVDRLGNDWTDAHHWIGFRCVLSPSPSSV